MGIVFWTNSDWRYNVGLLIWRKDPLSWRFWKYLKRSKRAYHQIVSGACTPNNLALRIIMVLRRKTLGVQSIIKQQETNNKGSSMNLFYLAWLAHNKKLSWNDLWKLLWILIMICTVNRLLNFTWDGWNKSCMNWLAEW